MNYKVAIVIGMIITTTINAWAFDMGGANMEKNMQSINNDAAYLSGLRFAESNAYTVAAEIQGMDENTACAHLAAKYGDVASIYAGDWAQGCVNGLRKSRYASGRQSTPSVCNDPQKLAANPSLANVCKMLKNR